MPILQRNLFGLAHTASTVPLAHGLKGSHVGIVQPPTSGHMHRHPISASEADEAIRLRPAARWLSRLCLALFCRLFGLNATAPGDAHSVFGSHNNAKDTDGISHESIAPDPLHTTGGPLRRSGPKSGRQQRWLRTAAGRNPRVGGWVALAVT